MSSENLTGMDAVLAKVDSRAALARALGITRDAVAKWAQSGKVPSDRVGEVARVTGLSPAIIRPDIFGEVA
jgi:DNA-binding transcriptional regulator YdaS (Cro superfamily)